MRIVITGLGAVTPLGNSVEKTREAIAAGRCAAANIGRFDAAAFPCRRAACAADPDPDALGVAPREARVMRQAGLWLLAAAREAVLGAGLVFPAPYPEAVGFFAAMAVPDPLPEDLASAARASAAPDPTASGTAAESGFPNGAALDWTAFYAGGYREIHPLWPLGMLNNVAYSVVPTIMDIRGENAVFAPAADAGAFTFAEAADAIRCGRCRLALAGGAAGAVTPLGLARAHLQAGLAEGVVPEAACEVILGEGAAAAVLEAEPAALARGVRPLGILRGWGFAAAPVPATAARNAIATAKTNAAAPTGEVGHVVVLGGLTSQADEELGRAALAALGAGPGSVVLRCPGRQWGELGAAAAAAALALSLPAPAGSFSPGERGRLTLVLAASPEGPVGALILEPWSAP